MYTLDNLKKLRQETGVSFSVCKKALEEAGNDLQKAKEILRKMGEAFFETKKEKETKIGAIFVYLHHNQQVAAMVELLCESDFVAKNEEFQKLGNNLAMQIASMDPKTKEELLNQPFIKDQSLTVAQLIKETTFKTGENIKIGRFFRLMI